MNIQELSTGETDKHCSQSLRDSTKIFFCGAVLAAVLAGAGFVNSYWLDHKLALLEAECVESGQRERKRTGLDVRPVCDGETFAGLARQQKFDGTGPIQGEQAKMASMYNEVQSSAQRMYILAIILLGLSAVPWTWYFLLQRIRELCEAIIGK